MNSNLIAINHDPEALARHVEGEFLDPATDLRALSADELRGLMAFEPVEMFYGSPPCAHFAPRQSDPNEVQP